MGKLKTGFARHLSRYLRHKTGKTIEEIAAEDGIKDLKAVRGSIRVVDEYREQNTVPYLNEALIEMIMNNVGVAGASLTKALKAKTPAGKDDHKTQMTAFREMGVLASAIQPKPQRGINLNVNQQQSAAALSAGVPTESSFLGYEERLMKIRAKVDQHNQLPFVSVAVKDDDDISEEEVVEAEVASPGSPTV